MGPLVVQDSLGAIRHEDESRQFVFGGSDLGRGTSGDVPTRLPT